MIIFKAKIGKWKSVGELPKSQKIKNLFQEFKIPDWKRDKIPLIYIDGRIAAVGDLWVCDEFHADSLEEGISIIWDGFGNKNGE